MDDIRKIYQKEICDKMIGEMESDIKTYNIIMNQAKINKDYFRYHYHEGLRDGLQASINRIKHYTQLEGIIK